MLKEPMAILNANFLLSRALSSGGKFPSLANWRVIQKIIILSKSDVMLTN
ncbi:hypothetical protein Hanom_Chr05g00462321 [Helianthus anomalus]